MYTTNKRTARKSPSDFNSEIRQLKTEKGTETTSNAQSNEGNTWRHATLVRVTREEACTQKNAMYFDFCCASREKAILEIHGDMQH